MIQPSFWHDSNQTRILGELALSGSNLQSPFQPSNPKMSEYKEISPGGSGHRFNRSGGPPKSDWSGIDPKKSTMQLWSFNPAHEQKEHAKRVEGLPVKFKQGHSLTESYDSVTRKLE